MFKGLTRLMIGTKINMLLISILLLLSVGICIVANYEIKKGMLEFHTKQLNSESMLGYMYLNQKYPGDWNIQEETLYKGKTKIEGDSSLVDEIGKLTGNTVTIFRGDTRIATNLMDHGTRVIGTKADPKVATIVLKNGQTYLGEADIVGINHLTTYIPLKNAQGEVIGMWLVATPLEDIDQTIISLLKSFIIIISLFIILALFCTLLFTRKLKKRLYKMVEAFDQAGNGNFLITLHDPVEDEIGLLTQAFIRMKDNIRGLIQQVQSSSEQVAATSEELTASVEQNSKATEQITAAMQEIAHGTEMQVASSTHVNHATQEITQGMNQVTSSILSVSDLSRSMEQQATTGNQVVHQTIEQMSLVQNAVGETATLIHDLGQKSNEIGQIVSLITEIANQTNLLSLNAAIEAARAGDHGRGFAVVADEVRLLAEQSRKAASEIRELIGDVQIGSNKAVESMNHGTEVVKEGIRMVHLTGDAFSQIVKMIEEITMQSQEVAAVVEEVSSSSENMVVMIEKVGQEAIQTSGRTQHIAVSTQEQNTSMAEITSSSEGLSSLALELLELISKFKV
ncbi:MAG TPA: methyl-accepting chemotaxis protein [Bacillota bacterium]|nr:methyl-accepting chemotaxis protein [Bacillota bacterium]